MAKLITILNLTCASKYHSFELIVGHQPWPHNWCWDTSLTPQRILRLTMSVALLVVVQLALLIPTPIASPLAQAPCSSVSAVIVMRSHCSSARLVAHFMSLAATAQRCVSSIDWALKL
jgi:hypothetical protein